MKRVAAVGVLLLVAACSAEPERRTTAQATTPAPTAAPSPASTPSAAPDGVLVAVVRGNGDLELHRVDRGSRAAALERVLAPPSVGATALDVAFGGSTVCATWYVGEGDPFEQERTSLVCYPDGSATGRVVAGAVTPVELALSADGTRLAYAQLDQGENQVVHTARLSDGALSASRRFLALASEPEGTFTGTAVQDLAWIDDDELAISTGVESDDGPNLLRFDVAAPGTRGWLGDAEAVEVQTPGYLTYDSVVSVAGTEALAVERGSYLDEPSPPHRAVRVDLGTGRVLQVLATAAEGRIVSGVSGSRDAVVYVTGAGDEPRTVYLRLAGEQRGARITGLPADAEQVLASA